MSLPRHQQGEAEQPQVRAPLLGVAPLRKLRPHVGGGDKGEEVGDIVEQGIEFDAELLHDGLRELVLNRAQRLQFDAVHLVPEELRGQLLDLQLRKQPME